MRALWLATALLAAAGPSMAQDFPSAAVQDARTMMPDSAPAAPGRPGELAARVLIEQGGRWLPVPYLAFHGALAGKPVLAAADQDGVVRLGGCQGSEPVSAYADLTEADFSIRPLLARRLAVRGTCGQSVELRFSRANPSAIALRVWRVATLARVKLAGLGPSAWPRGVVFHVNAEGATNGTDVGVSPDATTFVVGHELGHAVSNAHRMIQMGFGDSFHTMTGCIGESAALEEGWASFFGAWVDQGFGAADPVEEWDDRQRIPIKSLPSEVQVGAQGERAAICAGTDNEMRVTSFLWNTAAPAGLSGMKALWSALDGKRLASVAGVARSFEEQGTDASRLAPIWEAAFRQPMPPSL